MLKTALVGAQLVDPESGSVAPGTLLIDRGRLVDRLAAEASLGEDWSPVDLTGRTVAPGFIDLHFHGALFTAAPDEFAAALARASREMIASGTTSFLATTLAWGRDDLPLFVDRLVAAIAGGAAVDSTCLGLHLEGPWLSPSAPGAMPPNGIRPFEPGRDSELLERAGSKLRMVTLAPEIEGANALIDELGRRDVLAALGHTRAGEREIQEGIGRGLRHVTHLFNAMGPIHHREPGVAGVVLAESRLCCDLICDGHHVHPHMVRLAASALGERLVLISDRVDLPGPAPEPGEPARLPDGTLAGSQLTLDRAIHNARLFADLELADAVAACSLRPARLLGIENERGTLRRGARADLAVLSADGAPVETWIEGIRVWSAAAGSSQR